MDVVTVPRSVATPDLSLKTNYDFTIRCRHVLMMWVMRLSYSKMVFGVNSLRVTELSVVTECCNCPYLTLHLQKW